LEKGKITKEWHHDSGDIQGGTIEHGSAGAPVILIRKGPLEGLVKIQPDAIGNSVPDASKDAFDSYQHVLAEWYAEDEKLLGSHPKDPYKRIECLPSAREIRIMLDGQVVAQSTNNVFLHETMLRTRYYLPFTSVAEPSMLVPSKTSTFCPYKGQASYYSLKVGDKLIEDAVWYYIYPTAESAAIQGRLCFYNEKVDVFVDGVKEG